MLSLSLLLVIQSQNGLIVLVPSILGSSLKLSALMFALFAILIAPVSFSGLSSHYGGSGS